VLPSVLVPCPCHRKSDVRIDAQRQRLLLAVESIAIPPVAATVRCYEQMQSTAVRDLPRLLRAPGAANLSIGEHLLVLFGLPESRYQQIYQQGREAVRAVTRPLETLKSLFLRYFLPVSRSPEMA
jgi:hypothetical protein